jgi:tRNA modification GTPase
MIGVKRAREQMQRADHVILVVTAEDVVTNQDSFSANEDFEALLRALGSEAALELGEVSASNILLLINKIDLVDPKLLDFQRWPVTYVSAKTGEGLAALTKKLVQLSSGGIEGTLFTARLRHVHALEKTRELLVQAKQGLSSKIGAELVAEDCRMAHQFLGQIMGTVSPDDLLGEIFSSFCIGK